MSDKVRTGPPPGTPLHVHELVGSLCCQAWCQQSHAHPAFFFLSSLLGSFETPLSSSLPFQPMLTLSTGVVVQAVLRGERPRKATYRGVERCCKKGPNLWPSSPSTALRTCTATMCMGSSSANTQLYGCTLNWPPYLRIKTQLRCSFPATHSHMLVAHSFTWQASASYTLVSAM